jgi:predicted aspartyl protease
MSKLFVDVTLKNRFDEVMEKPVRQAEVKMLADTGAEWSVLSEDIQAKLGLPEPKSILVTVVGGKKILCPVVDGLKVILSDTLDVTVSALVVPGQKYCILGVTTLEQMGLAVDPLGQKLYPVYGEGIVGGIGC